MGNMVTLHLNALVCRSVTTYSQHLTNHTLQWDEVVN